MVSLCATSATSVRMRHPLLVVYMHKHATSMLAINTATYAPHGARRYRALRRVAGGGTGQGILEGLEHT